MPRYFFNVYDGHSDIDQEGTELADIEGARKEAIAAAGTILSESADTLPAGKSWRMEVTDATRNILFTLHFSLEDAAGRQENS